MILPKELTVTGIFETGHYLHDSEFLLVPVYVGQELYGLRRRDCTASPFKTDNPYGAERVKQAIEQFLEPPEYAQTWIDMNRPIFRSSAALSARCMFFLLFFIVVVAAFGIMSTLITVTVQKRREIGIMKALGANIAQVIWVFLGQGTIVGLFRNSDRTRARHDVNPLLATSSASGWHATLHIEIFPREVYQFSAIPAEVIPRDVAIICISAFFICSIAALIPAYFAARLDPVKAAALRVSCQLLLTSATAATHSAHKRPPERGTCIVISFRPFTSDAGPATLGHRSCSRGQNRRSTARPFQWKRWKSQSVRCGRRCSTQKWTVCSVPPLSLPG